MKNQVFNPYLPSYEYIPDGEPHIFGDRLYIYGSHDKFNGYNFCLNDYACWSAPLDDLSDWKYEGVIYRRLQDPDGKKHTILCTLAAPDVCQGGDGRYYLYYFVGGNGMIAVAVCDTPAGQYEYLGHVSYEDGIPIGKKGEPYQFDPGIFIDDDGRIYLYTGFGLTSNLFLLGGHKPTYHGPMCFELCQDMLTVKRGPAYIGVKSDKESKGTPYAGHGFLEASSMRKFNGIYYFIYSSIKSHELCYAYSDKPTKGFLYGGTLVSNGDIGLTANNTKDAVNYTGNTHGSLIKLKDDYYIFYHRHTNRKQFSRQACAEKIKFENNKFYQAEITSCGLNGKPLKGKGSYEARIACHLTSKSGPKWYWAFKGPKGNHPYFTQTGKDREDHPNQFIANICDGATAGFKYFTFEESKTIEVKVRGKAKGYILVTNKVGGEVVAKIPISLDHKCAKFEAIMNQQNGIHALYFTYRGSGNIDFISFTLK